MTKDDFKKSADDARGAAGKSGGAITIAAPAPRGMVPRAPAPRAPAPRAPMPTPPFGMRFVPPVKTRVMPPATKPVAPAEVPHDE